MRREQSFRIQLFGACIVLVLAVWLPLEDWEQVALILLVFAVLILEVVNSMMERIADALKPRFHDLVRDVKDMMAGAVLLAALASVIAGGMILIPRLWHVAEVLGLLG